MESMDARELADDLNCSATPVTAEKPTVELKNGVYLVLHQGLHYVVDSDICSCGHERVVENDMGTPAMTAYERRYHVSCLHQRIIMNMDGVEACPDCGCHVADREKMRDDRGNWSMTKWTCTECGTERYA